MQVISHTSFMSTLLSVFTLKLLANLLEADLLNKRDQRFDLKYYRKDGAVYEFFFIPQPRLEIIFFYLFINILTRVTKLRSHPKIMRMLIELRSN